MRLGLAAAVAAAAFGAASPALADSDQHAQTAQSDVTFVSREFGAVQTAVDRARSEKTSVEARIANGELLYRSKDYNRAIVVFSEILEDLEQQQLMNSPGYADALWLRAETYYAAHEYLAARRDYKTLLDGTAKNPRFQTYFGRALARVVDVALRLNDPPDQLKDIFDRFNQVPPAQVDAGLNYAKGKAYYKAQRWSEAQSAFQQVQDGSPYTHQARYFQGIVAMKLARQNGGDPTVKGAASGIYKQAIETFRVVTTLAADTADHRHVIDLAWMAIGRLFYEMEQYQQAAEAYAKVGRESPEFDTMLFELAWVYVRLGDVQRAERALEVLSIADPGSTHLADGTLLRADLLLRAGAFDKALQLYTSVRDQYDPMRQKVEKFLENTDVAVYYQKLSEQQLDLLDQNEALPPVAVRWAREAENGPAAFAVIDDINECKTLIKQSNEMVVKLTALLGAANAARAFPELKAGIETALMLLNRIGHARLEIARGLDDELPQSLGGELADVHAKRVALMDRMSKLPTSQADFAAREADGVRQWNSVSQSLQRLQLEVDQLQAIVNGLRRWLKEDSQRGVARDPATVSRFQAELDANEHDIKKYREEIADLRRSIEIGRAQAGMGDKRYQDDEDARRQFRQLLAREMQLVAAGQANGGSQSFARKNQGLLSTADQYEDRLEQAKSQLDAQVEKRAGDLRKKIEDERLALAKYQAQLEAYDVEAKDLVGHVAQQNFMIVRDKLRGIVLRADVGITEQAWEVREEEMSRVRNLLTERQRQSQLLDEELREVRDDGADTSKQPEKK
jgi:tetratricopeptide (TPR) repeat protein